MHYFQMEYILESFSKEKMVMHYFQIRIIQQEMLELKFQNTIIK
jgi:hypothetical protein